MLYLVVALKPEAQAFVDKYKLQKTKLGNFTLFSNPSMILIISGIGVNNAAQATQTLINHYDITDNDIYLNIGICGASSKYKIGALLEIGKLVFNEKITILPNLSDKKLTCVEEEATTSKYEIIDMESYGFYDAVVHSPAIKNFHILKVVSDHFEPSKVTKEKTKSLLFNVIDAINIIINKEEHL